MILAIFRYLCVLTFGDSDSHHYRLSGPETQESTIFGGVCVLSHRFVGVVSRAPADTNSHTQTSMLSDQILSQERSFFQISTPKI